MRKYTFILVAVAMCLAACAKAPAASASEPQVIGVVPTAIPEETLVATERPAPADTQSGASAEATEAFRAALTALLTTHTLPDGTDCGFDEAVDPTGNRFAIYDVDRDGRDELVLEYTTTFTAGQIGAIYDHDAASGALRAELTEYPLLTVYENGAIRAGWSHNQGLAGSFWPYTLYLYDTETDSYRAVGMVDAWEKAFAPTDAQGNAFPDDVDTSGTGMVYYIMPGGAYAEVAPVDASAYEAWRNGYLAGAAEIELPYNALLDEAVAELR